MFLQVIFGDFFSSRCFYWCQSGYWVHSWEYKFVGVLAKIEHMPRKLFYFVIRHPQSLPKLGRLSNTIFREKSINSGLIVLTFFWNSNFQTFYFWILCPIYVLGNVHRFTKCNDFHRAESEWQQTLGSCSARSRQ
jgi:hypothetical protein